MEIRDSKGLTEEEYIKVYKSKNYNRPYLTADIVVFDKEDKILLVKRKGHPYIGRYALPGGFADENETIEETAKRELMEETGVENVTVVPVGLYSEPGRDPRGWVVSQLFYSKLNDYVEVTAGDDAAEALWFKIISDSDKIFLENQTARISISDLAFDHEKMIREVLSVLSR